MVISNDIVLIAVRCRAMFASDLKMVYFLTKLSKVLCSSENTLLKKGYLVFLFNFIYTRSTVMLTAGLRGTHLGFTEFHLHFSYELKKQSNQMGKEIKQQPHF